MPARKFKSVPTIAVSNDPIINHLAESILFKEIKDNKEALAYVAREMQEAKYAKGTAIFKTGDVDDRMFCLVSGSAEVTKTTLDGDRFQVAILHAEKHVIFGEGALIDVDARSATIKALTDCTCLVWNREKFQKFCADQPQWALPVLHQIAYQMMDRLRRLNGDFSLLYNALVKQIRGN